MDRREADPAARTTGVEWARVEWSDLVERLSARKATLDRYSVFEEIGRGGMGRVLRVRDEDLHRDLAMKVMRRDGLAGASDPSQPTMLTARFVEEAQVAGQLDHPGIVPVHDVGLDGEGQFYFTMKLVRGRTFEKVLELARTGAEGWSTTRVLNVLLRVCEAMGYAHERGVLHRDLKPSNVMIGDHGEVYVMDWGLARLLGRPDGAPTPGRDQESTLQSARHSSWSGSSSPFVTEADRVVGTPTFMSPEQSAGASAELSPQSDVYSVGAMLYVALAGRAPYSEPGKPVDNRDVWMKLQQGPPAPVGELAPRVAPELVSICEKAMARSLADRYPSMKALGEDLRAYLELRVVQAHRTGPWHELRKWVVRNKAVAGSILAVLCIVCAAGFWVAHSERSRALAMELQAENGEALQLVQTSLRYSSVAPARIEEAERWLTRARYFVASRDRREAEQALLGKRCGGRAPRIPDPKRMARLVRDRSVIAEMEADLVKLEEQAGKPGATAEHREQLRTAREVYPAELEGRKRRVAELESTLAREDLLSFADPVLQDEYETREALLESIRILGPCVARVELRIAETRRLRQSTLVDCQSDWDKAIASIANRTECPLYEGLVIRPQLGLVPLRRDSRSGLWEFWHVLSGERPLADGDGPWRLMPNTGIVLVLVPGGTALAGAQNTAVSAGRHDPLARPNEALRSARLEPFFVSKYEFTQGQGLWIADQNPSFVVAGMQTKGTPRTTRTNPLESGDWDFARGILESVGLLLPTELQWEYAARAGSDKRFGSTDDFAELEARVNHADASVGRYSKLAHGSGEDGCYTHARVDAYDPNPFGLLCVFGNVSEWCLDWWEDDLTEYPPRDGDGLVTPRIKQFKAIRGGSYLNGPVDQRLSARRALEPFKSQSDVGFRAARPLDP